jgi:hypothetical protein
MIPTECANSPNAEETMKYLPIAMTALLALFVPATASATGLAICNSGPESGWQSQDAMSKHLLKTGWREVRRMKVDGNCYEVYGINENGRQVESYFHPVTLQHILTTQR